MKRTKIKNVISSEITGAEVTVCGWVRTFRNNQFISINDGSTIENIQAVVELEKFDAAMLKRVTTGAAVSVTGELVKSIGKGQGLEIKVSQLEILGDSDAEKFPIQSKKHTLEFLREHAHLRFRTNTFNAIFKIRHTLAFAIHEFFNARGFVYLHTPIITASDAEGAGEMFKVTSLNLDKIPRADDGMIDFKEDFFGRQTNLTVSGQLEGELGAMALGDIYTFGPTFRAENSNTSRHLAEFWMIEPEMAFADLDDNIKLAEDLLQYSIRKVAETCLKELDFLNNRFLEEEKTKPADERAEKNLFEKLESCIKYDFARISYTEAFEILKNSNHNKKKKFKYTIENWGVDLQSEHERFLVEKHFRKPVIITDYPKNIKAFYMRQNDDGKTVRAMDILFPGIGEIIGGSQREERLELLENRMKEMNISTEELDWYLDTRRFGTAPHAGFGLGFERLVLFVTGMSNIRDVIPFPRTPKSAKF